jgi:hypothetical protein
MTKRSTEHDGQGQSGYAAGRTAGDQALERELEPRNPAHPKGTDEDHALEKGDDERFRGSGRGRRDKE